MFLPVKLLASDQFLIGGREVPAALWFDSPHRLHFFESRSERASLTTSPPAGSGPEGITGEGWRGVIRENGGLRLPANLSGQVRTTMDSTQCPVAAAQRLGTADGLGDGSSVGSELKALKQLAIDCPADLAQVG